MSENPISRPRPDPASAAGPNSGGSPNSGAGAGPGPQTPARAPVHKTQPPARVSVIGSRYSLLRREAAHEFLLKHALAGGSGYVCVSNVHTTMMGFFDEGYQRITNESLLSVPDGMPLVWAMNSLGPGGQDRIRGPSLMRDLFDKGRGQQLKHYLYGGSPAALKALQETLLQQYPGALIVGAESPPFKALAAVTEEEWAAAARRINESGAQLVWIGLGAPKQERWMVRQRTAVKGVMLGVGAAFDLIPGRIPEAPAFLQALGLEWAYRFLREPRRLWRRYLFNNPAFLVLWGLQWVGSWFRGRRG
jgi:N-acetylglucosaminyldiphosphoundecaprenol N-acetyl-beta-D-mannosaminyltransferase